MLEIQLSELKIKLQETVHQIAFSTFQFERQDLYEKYQRLCRHYELTLELHSRGYEVFDFKILENLGLLTSNDYIKFNLKKSVSAQLQSLYYSVIAKVQNPKNLAFLIDRNKYYNLKKEFESKFYIYDLQYENQQPQFFGLPVYTTDQADTLKIIEVYE